MLISTDRLFLREMEQSDFRALCLMLQDEYEKERLHLAYSATNPNRTSDHKSANERK